MPPGRYYLADAGFVNCDMLLAPYHAKRHHLKEFKHGNQRYGQEVEGAPALSAAEKTRADDRRDRIAQAMWDTCVLEHPDLQ